MDVTVIGQISDAEKKQYIDHILLQHPTAKNIKITVIDNDTIDLDYEVENIPFERIRRITGYLVGTVDRWNDGKKAELKDRIPHNLPTANIA